VSPQGNYEFNDSRFAADCVVQLKSAGLAMFVAKHHIHTGSGKCDAFGVPVGEFK
jgi:hypothetical protein